MFGLIAAIIIAFFSMFIPGVLLAYALLYKTELQNFEVIVIGFIFGLIAPATMTWLEAYLIDYLHFFTFSLALFEVNVLILTIIGAILCYREGLFTDIKLYFENKSSKAKENATRSDLNSIRSRLNRFNTGKEIVKRHIEEENSLKSTQTAELNATSNLSEEARSKMDSLHRESRERLREEQLKEETTVLQELESNTSPASNSKASHTFKPPWWVWAILLILMLVTFYTRLQSIVIAPKFLEFDPYFDMVDTHYILSYGRQLLLDPSAWPVVAAGTNHRIQPIVPYLEAFWYSLVNVMHFHKAQFSTSLMSYVSSLYPPITGALLVFVIFLLLYHEYDEKIGLIGAALTAMMPVLLTTFIAGEQLVEPWGIFTLFFFFATYMLAIRNKKDKRLAVLAGIAFASTFLGAHYYTVTAGVVAAYIILEGIIDILRNESLKDFYKMNVLMFVVIIILYALYAPYQATLQSNLSSVFGIPIILAILVFPLLLIAILDLVPKQLSKRKIIIKQTNLITNLAIMILALILILGAIFFTPLGSPIKSYIKLSAAFTTPSKPLFLTVQEYIPTGLVYDFGTAGFGAIGAGFANIPLLVWAICGLSIILLIISIIFRRSKTGVLYLSIALPLMFAGFSEVKYLPHFGVAYIMLFGIILGEFLFLASDKFKLVMKPISSNEWHFPSNVYKEHPLAAQGAMLIGIFFIFGLIGILFCLAYILIYRYGVKQTKDKMNTTLIGICLLLAIFSFSSHLFLFGESGTFIQAFNAQIISLTNGSNTCNVLSNQGNSVGYNLYCNTIPQYWLDSMAWINANVGPNAPRVLAWWDYGDWINWFGNSNAVLRGDNSVASEDYAVAAEYVLGPKYNATPQTLASYMNANQSKYILFDQDLIQKWGALDFLACVNINATSRAYAIAQGASSSPPVPYALGSSPCEIAHDPEFALLPLSALIQSNLTGQQQTISNYCQISNSNKIYIRSYLVVGNNPENNTVCVDGTPNANGVLSVYNNNGTKLNAVIPSGMPEGEVEIQSSIYVEFLVLYLPNSTDGTIINPPSQFYESNYYRGFILGNLPGFKEVYPSNSTPGSINFVNGTYPIRIYELINYTGGLPPVPPKPSWIHNNDTLP